MANTAFDYTDIPISELDINVEIGRISAFNEPLPSGIRDRKQLARNNVANRWWRARNALEGLQEKGEISTSLSDSAAWQAAYTVLGQADHRRRHERTSRNGY